MSFNLYPCLETYVPVCCAATTHPFSVAMRNAKLQIFGPSTSCIFMISIDFMYLHKLWAGCIRLHYCNFELFSVHPFHTGSPVTNHGLLHVQCDTYLRSMGTWYTPRTPTEGVTVSFNSNVTQRVRAPKERSNPKHPAHSPPRPCSASSLRQPQHRAKSCRTPTC